MPRRIRSRVPVSLHNLQQLRFFRGGFALGQTFSINRQDLASVTGAANLTRLPVVIALRLRS